MALNSLENEVDQLLKLSNIAIESENIDDLMAADKAISQFISQQYSSSELSPFKEKLQTLYERIEAMSSLIQAKLEQLPKEQGLSMQRKKGIKKYIQVKNV